MEKQYKFPEIIMDAQVAQGILSGEIPVLLYGMGAAAAGKIRVLRELGVQIQCGLDRNKKLWGTQLSGVPIYQPEEFSDTDKPVIICTESYYYEICVELKQLKFHNILPYFFYHSGVYYTYDDYRRISNDANKAVLFNEAVAHETKDIVAVNSVDLTITEKCSLRCKDCSNLMQFFEKPKDASLEKSLIAIDKIADAVDAVNEIRVLGGEPFLSKDFSKYMNHICKIRNVGTIVVYSNATIIPRGGGIAVSEAA